MKIDLKARAKRLKSDIPAIFLALPIALFWLLVLLFIVKLFIK